MRHDEPTRRKELPSTDIKIGFLQSPVVIVNNEVVTSQEITNSQC